MSDMVENFLRQTIEIIKNQKSGAFVMGRKLLSNRKNLTADFFLAAAQFK